MKYDIVQSRSGDYIRPFVLKIAKNSYLTEVTWPWQGLVMELTFYTEQWKFYISDLKMWSGMSYESVCSFVLPFNSLLDNTFIIT